MGMRLIHIVAFPIHKQIASRWNRWAMEWAGGMPSLCPCKRPIPLIVSEACSLPMDHEMALPSWALGLQTEQQRTICPAESRVDGSDHHFPHNQPGGPRKDQYLLGRLGIWSHLPPFGDPASTGCTAETPNHEGGGLVHLMLCGHVRTYRHTDKHFNTDSLVWGSLMLTPIM